MFELSTRHKYTDRTRSETAALCERAYGSIFKQNMNKGNLLTLFGIVFLDLMGLGIMIPVVAPLMLDPVSTLVPAAWSSADRNIAFGFLVAMYPLSQFFGAPILGALSDRHGRKKLLTFSLLGTFLGFVLFAIGLYTQQLWLLYFSRALDGFTGGNIGVANSAIADMYAEQTPAKRRPSSKTNLASGFGLIGMAFGLGFIFGPYLGGKLADPKVLPWFNVATPFWFAALLSLASLTLVTLLFKETLKTKTHNPIHFFMGFRHIAKAFQMHNLKTIFLVVFFHTLGFFFYTQFLPVFLVQKFQFDTPAIATLFAFIGLWIALAQGLFIRFFTAFAHPQQILRFSLFALSLLLFLSTAVPTVFLLYFIQPFLALAEGLSFPSTTAVVSELSLKGEQGEAMGVTQSLRALGQAVPSLIAGFLVTLNQNLAILTGAGIILLAGGIFVICFRPLPRAA